MLTSPVEAITKQVTSLMASQIQPYQVQLAQTQLVHPSPTSLLVTAACSLCGSVRHKEDTCLVGAYFAPPIEDVNYLRNIYNPGWRNHPNLSWGGRQGIQYFSGQNNAYKLPHI